MPIRYNASPIYLQPRGGEGPAVAPGAGHEFSDEEIASGLDGAWVDVDPRAGLAEEREFKAKRDAKRDKSDTGSAAPSIEASPAEPGDNKEDQPA